jgi:hypothetical protein
MTGSQHPAPPKGPPKAPSPEPEHAQAAKRPLPKPGDPDWVAGSPVDEEEAAKTQKEADAKLAAGKKQQDAQKRHDEDD